MQTKVTDGGPLLNGQVHLWWVSLAISKEQQHAFTALLSEHQKRKLQRLSDPEKRRLYIAGRGYLYQLLQHYCSDEQTLELQFGEHGKPSLRHNIQDLHFNFTDTCGYGLFAFARSCELGVDVENLHRKGKFEKIIQRRFSAQEQYLQEETTEQFLRCWTRKEAYGKAIGKGLNYPLRDHVMCVDLNKSDFFIEKQQWHGQQFSILLNEQETEGSSKKFVACLFSQGQKAKNLKAFHLL